MSVTFINASLVPATAPTKHQSDQSLFEIACLEYELEDDICCTAITCSEAAAWVWRVRCPLCGIVFNYLCEDHYIHARQTVDMVLRSQWLGLQHQDCGTKNNEHLDFRKL